jgi:hypothetical protein
MAILLERTGETQKEHDRTLISLRCVKLTGRIRRAERRLSSYPYATPLLTRPLDEPLALPNSMRAQYTRACSPTPMQMLYVINPRKLELQA